MEDVDWLWIITASFVACLFQNKLMFLLKIMLIYDLYWAANLQYALGHLPLPRRWRLTGLKGDDSGSDGDDVSNVSDQKDRSPKL